MTWIRDDELASVRLTAKSGPSVWGPWTYDATSRVLDYRGSYPIDLDRLTGSAKVLDIIAQVAGKEWGTAEVVGWLVIALNELFDLQAHMCGSGRSRRFNPRKHLRAGSRHVRSVRKGMSDGVA